MLEFFSSLENVGNKNILFATSTRCQPLRRSIAGPSVSSLLEEWAGTLPQVALCCFYSYFIPDSSMTLPSAREGD